MNQKRNAVPIYLRDSDKAKLENLADAWGVTLSSAVQRLIKDAEIPKVEFVPLLTLKSGRDVQLDSLKSVLIDKRHTLPSAKGIYIVIDAKGKVLYVGKASGRNGLRGRWIGRWSHHKDSDVIRNGATRIKYLELDPSCIDTIEADLISMLNPMLNNKDENAARSADVSYLANPEWQIPDEFEYTD